jgi:UDP-N-acetyl-D-glucosamine dehydrogenase
MHKDSLINRLNNKQAIIGIVGMGYVGLPLLLRFAEVGYRVIGFDNDEVKITHLNQQKSYIGHIPDERLSACQALYMASSDLEKVAEVDALILCLPTPLNKYREPDLSYIVDTVDKLTAYLRPGQIISLESTTYPGTTDEELLPRIEAKKLKVGEDIFLVYSPEREDPANHKYSTASIPKICGGVTPACLEAGLALYNAVIEKVVPVSSTRAAELTKLLENIHRAVNIGLVNEMKIVADKMNIDIFEVISAASTKPFGFVPYYPGPGLGGHCIPIDPFYLTWKAREFGLHTRFIELAGEINSYMPEWVMNKVISALNDRGKSLRGSSILVLGAAYKKNVDDIRESPAIMLMQMLSEKGAVISYSDPHVPFLKPQHEHSLNFQSLAVSEANLSTFDAVLIVTDHDAFDYEMIKNKARLVVDTRGVYKEAFSHLVKA